MSDDPYPTKFLQADCLKDRKWWCFLLSSIFTFLAGIFIVLIWRAFSFLCCRNRDPSEYQKQQEKDKLLAQQGQPPGQPKPKNLMEGNFVTEAKDWAGELISGQTTTGRILVSGSPCCLCLPDATGALCGALVLELPPLCRPL
ncbi:Calcium-activated potassium channel slowpoke [Portunus trituberculatus]|uniref:Calcium-activated potassium channel slowpoke n=1 Tax=Portunus trituberculatus TaxID=210409 RepID=A0A5B7CRL3_PORTR|nr:Calcium-activated potassium channel slowpoke [Portunus trituberculatus]